MQITSNKPIEIIKQLNVAKYTSSNIEDIRDFINTREYYQVQQFSQEPQMKFEIIDHALDRWNTRVGPSTDDIESLSETIAFLHSFRRVKLYPKNSIGIIDDEIIFTFEKKGKTTLITTFYGRVSLVPYLVDFEVLRRYNRKSGDSIRLEQPPDVLKHQSLVVHKKIMLFRGEHNKYMMEVFDAEGQDVIYITTMTGPASGKTIEIRNDFIDKSQKINISSLSALREAGYGDYVSNYIASKKNQRFSITNTTTSIIGA